MTGPRVLFIGHDASRTGAPAVLLHLLRWLGEHTPVIPEIVLIEGGPLTAQFEALGPTTVLGVEFPLSRYGLGALAKVRGIGGGLRWAVARAAWPAALRGPWDLIYANTVAAAPALRVAQRTRRRPAIVHVHEMAGQIAFYGGARLMRRLGQDVDQYVAAGDAVAGTLTNRFAVAAGNIVTVNEFISTTAARAAGVGDARLRLAAPVPADAWLVGGCGTVSARKGVDLLLDIAARTPALVAGRPVHFVWIGAADNAAFMAALQQRRAALALTDRFHLLPPREDATAALAAFDVFALPSRQDPMPLVALEAAAVGRPIVCFGGTGGIPPLLGDAGCAIVAPFDCDAAAARIAALLGDADRRTAMAAVAGSIVDRACDVAVVAPQIYARMSALIAGRP